MANKFLAWQLWVHYVLLEAIIVTFLHFTGQLVHWNPTDIILLYLAIALGDQTIHAILGALTGWKD